MTTTSLPPTEVTCPSWCTRADHDDEIEEGDGLFIHTGPALFEIATADGPVQVSLERVDGATDSTVGMRVNFDAFDIALADVPYLIAQLEKLGREKASAMRVDYGCPDWCERTDHDADLIDEGNPPLHYGPEFGLIAISGSGTAAPEAFVDQDGRSANAGTAALRQLAADAAAAAAWLEAHA